MRYNDGNTFKVTVLDEKEIFIEGGVIVFNINGVFYNAIDGNGIASLNINLLSEKYIITLYWNNYAKSNTIIIKD